MTRRSLLEVLRAVEGDRLDARRLQMVQGDVLRPHDPVLLFVVRGVVVTAREEDDGRGVLVEINAPGEVLLPSEPSAAATAQTRVASASHRATVDSEVIEYPLALIQQITEERPDLRLAFVSELASAVRRQTERMSDMALYTSVTRVARMYVDLERRLESPSAPGRWLEHGLSQHELARFVGVTRETFNRANRSLVSRDIVRVEHGSFQVVQGEALGRIASLRREADAIYAGRFSRSPRRPAA